jgi:surface polysaccharide O-acyltransferase-like enzyme
VNYSNTQEGSCLGLDSTKAQYSDNRNYSLEILRIISCFFIVFDHGNDADWAQKIGDLSLIIFVLLSAYFLSPQKKYAPFFSKRVIRLLIPWIFWFFIYGLLHIMNGKSFLPVTGDIFSAVLNGTRMHLWYLPFIFIINVVLVFYYNVVEKSSILKKYNYILFILLSIAFLFSMPLWRPWSLELGVPWGGWFLALPAVFIGAVIANLKHLSSDYWKIILYVLIMLMISTWLTLSDQWLGIPYLFSILLFVAAIFLKFDLANNREIIMKVSNCTFGVYLIHPLIYSIEKKIGFSGDFIMPFLTYALSLFIIILAHKIPVNFIKKII